MKLKIKNHKDYKNSNNQDIEKTMDSIERYLFIKIYTKIFGVEKDEIEIDEKLSNKLKFLKFLKTKHLDIPEEVELVIFLY
jgi:hypothetical protein